MNIIKKFKFEILGSSLCLTLGMLSGFVSGNSNAIWYQNLCKPSFLPPSWIFGPIWSLLYLMMGAALGQIWKIKKQNTLYLRLFALQFTFNLLWSPLFFYFHKIDFAFYNICLIWLTLFLLVVTLHPKYSINFLLLPYLLWTSFALVLNYQIYQMNPVL